MYSFLSVMLKGEVVPWCIAQQRKYVNLLIYKILILTLLFPYVMKENGYSKCFT